MSTTTLVTDTPPAQEQHHLVKAGDNVIFQNHEGKIYFVQGISSETKQKFYKKAQTSLGTVIGKPYFSFYEVKDKELHGPLNYNPGKDDILDTQDVQTHEQVKGDNRSLVDNNKSQALTSEDIAKLKKENVDAKTIISTLVEGSQTFHTKTQFAQEKYVERKKKKYLNFVKIVPPSVELICDHYFNGDADKVAHLRIDTLSQLMTLGNIYSGVRAMIFDTCFGVVTAAAVERNALVTRVYEEGKPNGNYYAVTLLNAPPSYRKVQPLVPTPTTFHAPFSFFHKMNTQLDSLISDVEKNAVDFVKSNAPESLLIATQTHDIGFLFDHLFPHLAPAGCFAIYSPYMKPLEELFIRLKVQSFDSNAKVKVLNLSLSETFLREFQVLPLRTHPVMRMKCGQGYILSGIKVVE